MADEKIYTPEVVEENPFPGGVEAITTSEKLPEGTFAPATIKDKPNPRKKYANELLSTSLNTRSRKILQEFELQQSGGIKVGDFKEGISGDLRITPNGLTARNIAGITTFVIDGDTGDAIFAGTLQAGTLIGANGTVVVEESIYGGGRILLYNNGVPSILIGDTDE